MRKNYPYLEESYTPYSKIPQKIAENYPYMRSSYSFNLNEEQWKEGFLAKIDNFVNQKQYINITLLDWQENPIKELQGIISSGSVSKDGNSSVRRSANLSCSVSYREYNIDNIEMDFALNKKIFIEIGIENKTNEYPEYPILWFPQGVFYINSFSINSSTSSAVNLNLNLKDKMCLLNGDIGGKLPAAIRFDTMTTQTSTGVILEEQKVLYHNIIMELVNHWGQEPLGNILIQDVPLRIRKIVQWNGDNNIYLVEEEDPETGSSHFQYYTQQNEDGSYNEYSKGDDVGYVYADFVPPKELSCAAGDTICSVLDTIKNQLGNYEYFYDVFGIFHFREIQNYLNINQSEIVLQETENPGRRISLEKGQFNLDTSTELQYLIDIVNDKTTFSFEGARNITSINVSPNYGNIKNDFTVNGIKENSSGIKMSVRYRLVIDNKPEIVGYTNLTHDQIVDEYDEEKIPYYGEFHDLVFYTHPYYGGTRLDKWVDVDKLPWIGNMDIVYHFEDNFYIWYENSENQKYEYIKLYLDKDKTEAPIQYDNYYAIDWRTFLLCTGLEANANGTDPGYYFEELNSFWPYEYDLRRENQKFFGQKEDGSIYYKTLTTGNYYFDIIDANSSSLGIYAVENIGRRAEVINDNDINCLFTPEIPNVVFLNNDHPENNWSDNTTLIKTNKIIDVEEMINAQRQECIDNWQPYILLSDEDYSKLIIGGYLNGAYEKIRYALFSHTTYQKTLNITALPAFYLEPNSRVRVSDISTNTFGDFIIQNINFSLGPGANMSVTMNEALERL